MAAPGKLVMVEWLDSCTQVQKWQDKDFGKTYGPVTCYSAGWLERRDKDATVLAASYGEYQIGDVSAIPSSCVVRVTRLVPRKR